jgi:hypothetical protein
MGSQWNNSWRDAHAEKKSLRSGRAYVKESLAYRTSSRYLEFLMVEGRIGNKLALLGL